MAIEMEEKQEKLILVSAQKKQYSETLAWESLDELEELVETAGGETVSKVLQRVDSINPGLYIGSGKVDEIREMIIVRISPGYFNTFYDIETLINVLIEINNSY